MCSLLIFTLVGVGAQLVEGALGMAFGVTASTLLVLSGLGATRASAAVHLAEVGTTLASGLSHWRFKNIDWSVVLKLVVVAWRTSRVSRFEPEELAAGIQAEPADDQQPSRAAVPALRS